MERVRTLHRVPAEALRYQPCGPATVIGDLDEIRAAVSNLIDNAVKYSGGGSQRHGGDRAAGRTLHRRCA